MWVVAQALPAAAQERQVATAVLLLPEAQGRPVGRALPVQEPLRLPLALGLETPPAEQSEELGSWQRFHMQLALLIDLQGYCVKGGGSDLQRWRGVCPGVSVRITMSPYVAGHLRCRLCLCCRWGLPSSQPLAGGAMIQVSLKTQVSLMLAM